MGGRDGDVAADRAGDGRAPALTSAHCADAFDVTRRRRRERRIPTSSMLVRDDDGDRGSGTAIRERAMARVTGIGGVFFKSRTDHRALAAWYRDHLGMQLEEFGGAILK